MPFVEKNPFDQAYFDFAWVALSEGLCPDCGAPVEICEVLTIKTLICRRDDTQWFPCPEMDVMDPDRKHWTRFQTTEGTIRDALG